MSYNASNNSISENDAAGRWVGFDFRINKMLCDLRYAPATILSPWL